MVLQSRTTGFFVFVFNITCVLLHTDLITVMGLRSIKYFFFPLFCWFYSFLGDSNV